MKTFVVSPAGKKPVPIKAPNWMVALGEVLNDLHALDALQRLACEVLPNGTVIATDLKGGGRFVVQERLPVTSSHPLMDDDSMLTLDPDLDMVEVDAFGSWLADIDDAGSSVFACQAALAASQVAVPCDSASVLILEDAGLRFVAAAGPVADKLVGRHIPPHAGAAGFAVQHRQAMVLYEVPDKPRHYEAIDESTGYATRNLCCVPVLFDDLVYGVIEVLNFPTTEPFDGEGIAMLEKVAFRLGRRLASTMGVAQRARVALYSSADPPSADEVTMDPVSSPDIALALPDDEYETYGDE
ncbi:MAG: GAF domain-containing protein [Myxococcota bacterium]